MTFREAFAALVVCVTFIVASKADHKELKVLTNAPHVFFEAKNDKGSVRVVAYRELTKDSKGLTEMIEHAPVLEIRGRRQFTNGAMKKEWGLSRPLTFEFKEDDIPFISFTASNGDRVSIRLESLAGKNWQATEVIEKESK
jgi:hypothetical protein